jgi:hypothetical protein
VIGTQNLRGCLTAGLVQLRRSEDIPHRATLRACAKQGALRAAQYLDPAKIEHHGRGRADTVLIVDGHRHVIEVNPDGSGPGRGTHATNFDVGLADPNADAAAPGVEGDARHGPRDVLDAGHVVFQQLILSQHGNACRNILEVLGALLGRNDDFLELIARLLRSRGLAT